VVSGHVKAGFPGVPGEEGNGKDLEKIILSAVSSNDRVILVCFPQKPEADSYLFADLDWFTAVENDDTEGYDTRNSMNFIYGLTKDVLRGNAQPVSQAWEPALEAFKAMVQDAAAALEVTYFSAKSINI
jgi:hypothetical protein